MSSPPAAEATSRAGSMKIRSTINVASSADLFGPRTMRQTPGRAGRIRWRSRRQTQSAAGRDEKSRRPARALRPVRPEGTRRSPSSSVFSRGNRNVASTFRADGQCILSRLRGAIGRIEVMKGIQNVAAASGSLTRVENKDRYNACVTIVGRNFWVAPRFGLETPPREFGTIRLSSSSSSIGHPKQSSTSAIVDPI